MKLLVVSSDSQAGTALLESCAAALPYAHCVFQSMDADLELRNALSNADVVVCRQDAGLYRLLELAPRPSVIVIGQDDQPEARVHAIRLGAAEYLGEGEWNALLVARIAHYVMEMRHLTARSESLASRLEFVTEHDPLTGARNRSCFFADLADMADLALAEEENLAAMLIGLDGFRSINDSLGQQAGDTVLKVVAQRVEKTLRDEDILYRVSGTQFAVILRHVGDEEGLRQAGQRIYAGINQPLHVFGQQVECGVSIGISRWPEDADNIDGLVTAADAALQAACSEGGGLRLTDASMLPPKVEDTASAPLTRH